MQIADRGWQGTTTGRAEFSGSARPSRAGLKAWPSLRVRCSGGPQKQLQSDRVGLARFTPPLITHHYVFIQALSLLSS